MTVIQFPTRERIEPWPSEVAPAPGFIIKYTDGAYNYGPGERNGFPCSRAEATRYETLELALAKAADLDDGQCVEDSVTGHVVQVLAKATA